MDGCGQLNHFSITKTRVNSAFSQSGVGSGVHTFQSSPVTTKMLNSFTVISIKTKTKTVCFVLEKSRAEDLGLEAYYRLVIRDHCRCVRM